MRKLVQLLVIACMVVLSTQIAFANSDKVTIADGADLTSVHRLAIAQPNYYQVDPKSPDKSLLCQIEYDTSRVATNFYVLSYNDVVKDVQTRRKVDMTKLNDRMAKAVFKENVSAVADGYITLTVANNSRTQFFFDVWQAGTNKLLYSYQIAANRNEADSIATYTNLCDQFYKHFARSVEEQTKAAAKKDKK